MGVDRTDSGPAQGEIAAGLVNAKSTRPFCCRLDRDFGRWKW